MLLGQVPRRCFRDGSLRRHIVGPLDTHDLNHRSPVVVSKLRCRFGSAPATPIFVWFDYRKFSNCETSTKTWRAKFVETSTTLPKLSMPAKGQFAVLPRGSNGLNDGLKTISCEWRRRKIYILRDARPPHRRLFVAGRARATAGVKHSRNICQGGHLPVLQAFRCLFRHAERCRSSRCLSCYMGWRLDRTALNSRHPART
jgi:hypothetical protein